MNQQFSSSRLRTPHTFCHNSHSYDNNSSYTRATGVGILKNANPSLTFFKDDLRLKEFCLQTLSPQTLDQGNIFVDLLIGFRQLFIFHLLTEPSVLIGRLEGISDFDESVGVGVAENLRIGLIQVLDLVKDLLSGMRPTDLWGRGIFEIGTTQHVSTSTRPYNSFSHGAKNNLVQLY